MSAGPLAAHPATTMIGRRRWAGAALLVGLAALALPIAVAVPLRLMVLAPVAAGLVALAYVRPPWAAYLLLAVTPLTAGIARGAYLPVLRPHEALGLLLGTGVALRALVDHYGGYRLRPRLTGLDVSILAMAVTSSLLPLLWMAARGVTPTMDDLLYASTIWKFYGLFVLIRASVRTERQVARCLYLSLTAYALVAVVTILQSLQIAGVPQLVNLVYATDDPRGAGAGRGSATLGSSIAVGDVMAFSVVICLALLLRRLGSRRLVVPVAALVAFGGLASGQFSGVIALAVAVFALAVLAGRVRQVLVTAAPVLLVAAVVLRPVVQARINDFEPSTGLPQSWTVRLENLRLFVWPQVFSGENWLFGVRPSSRIPVPTAWGPFIYIESGHTWLLWTGGVPFALAFLLFSWVAVRTTRSLAYTRRGAIGAAAAAGFAAVWAVFLLMAFDPHITMRGTADLLFSLLALATAAPDGTRRAAPPPASTLPSRQGADHAEPDRIVARVTPLAATLGHPSGPPHERR
jgi:hypothetical protein